eukprot:768512-Hanusia_phi.AAC.5
MKARHAAAVSGKLRYGLSTEGTSKIEPEDFLWNQLKNHVSSKQVIPESGILLEITNHACLMPLGLLAKGSKTSSSDMKSCSHLLFFVVFGVSACYVLGKRRSLSQTQDSLYLGLEPGNTSLCIDQTASNWTASYAGLHIMPCSTASDASQHILFANGMVLLESQDPDCFVANASDLTLELSSCNISDLLKFCVDDIGTVRLRGTQMLCLMAVEHSANENASSYYTLALQSCSQIDNSLRVVVSTPLYGNLSSDLKCSFINETSSVTSSTSQEKNSSMDSTNTSTEQIQPNPLSLNISMNNKTSSNMTSNMTAANWSNASQASTPMPVDVSDAFVSCAIQLINVNMNSFSKDDVLLAFAGAFKYALDVISSNMRNAQWQIEFAGRAEQVFENSTKFNLTEISSRRSTGKVLNPPKGFHSSVQSFSRVLTGGNERFDGNGFVSQRADSWSLREVGTEVFFFLRSSVVQDWVLSLRELDMNEDWSYFNSSKFPQTVSRSLLVLRDRLLTRAAAGGRQDVAELAGAPTRNFASLRTIRGSAACR